MALTRHHSLLNHTPFAERIQVAMLSSSNNTITFKYVVQDGDSTSDLDYTSSAALSLNGGNSELFFKDKGLVINSAMRVLHERPVPPNKATCKKTHTVVVRTPFSFVTTSSSYLLTTPYTVMKSKTYDIVASALPWR